MIKKLFTLLFLIISTALYAQNNDIHSHNWNPHDDGTFVCSICGEVNPYHWTGSPDNHTHIWLRTDQGFCCEICKKTYADFTPEPFVIESTTLSQPVQDDSKSILVFAMAFIILVCILIIWVIWEDQKSKGRHGVRIVVNGQEIFLTPKEYNEYTERMRLERESKERARQQAIINKKKAFESKVQALDTRILNDSINSDDIIRKKVLESLSRIKIENEDDYGKVVFLYNDGKLRSDKEVADFNMNIWCTKHRENYDSERHLVNAACLLIPFITVFCLVFFGVKDFRDLWFIGVPISLLPALLAGGIGCIIGNTINIANADAYGIPPNHPSVQEERTKRKVGIISTAAGVISVGHNTKKAAKDILNVDGCKKMK